MDGDAFGEGWTGVAGDCGRGRSAALDGGEGIAEGEGVFADGCEALGDVGALESGAAFVKEGYLLYYLPYTVGCGADGEPLFVLHFKR